MSGTTSTARRNQKSVLSSDNVCSIIETCAKNQVSELKFGDLQIRIGYTETAQPQASFETEISEAKLKQEDLTYIKQRETEQKEDEIDQMLIEDPYKFEELLEQGEFDAAESGGTERTDTKS